MKALRYTVIGGFAFILITGGLLVGLANLDANRYRGFLSEQISQRLGRSFEIRKDLSLSFYPYLEVDAAGVAVGNPDGFGEALFAQVDHLKLRIHTLSLIQKKLVMDAVQVNGVRVNLVKNKDGKGNWEAWQAPASAVPKNIQPEKKTDNGDSAVKERQPPVAVTLGQPGIHLPENFEAMLGLLGAGAEIKDANLEFNDLQSGKEFSVTDLDFHLAPFAPDTPMPLILGGRFEAGGLSGPVSLNASLLPDLTQNKVIITPFQVDLGMAGSRNIPEVSLSSAIEFDLAKDLLVLDQLAVTGPDTLVKGRISLFRISSEAPAMDMEIDAAGKDFTALLRAAGAERLADQFQGLTDKSFDVSGQVEASSAENTIVVSGLNIRMLDANIKGDVRVEQRRMGKPAMKGDLKAAGPDLPALIQVIAGILGKETAVSVIAPDLNRLKDKSFDLNTLFDTDLHGGRVEIKNLKARGLGIEIDSQISAHGIFSLMPAAKGRLRARGTDLPLVLALADSLTGKKEFSRWVAAAPGKSFETDVSMDLDMGRGRMTLPKFQVKGLGLTIDGRFDADKLGTKKAVLNGELDLAAREIGWLFKTVKQERAADFIHSLYVKTKISGGQGKVLLAPFLATADLTPAQAKQFPGGVELKAPLILDLTGQSISSDNILFRGMGLTLKGELKAENIQTTPGVTGQVDLSLKKLRKFMAAMDMPLPATADSKVFSVLELETKISGTRDSLALKGIKARLDDTGVTGRISLAGASNPAVDAVLGLDRINLDRYLPGPVQKETP
ncbi:MAG: AsmA family protein, partial [Desulfobacterales bacterium]|nr:AsmA family protein [Desulfobacterales bacterium]